MYVLLFKHLEGELEGRRDFTEFKTEKELLAFLLDNTIREENIKDIKILSAAVECEVNYALSLKPAKKRRVSAASVLARAEGEKPQEPEKKKVSEEAGRKCSVCGAGIKAWSKTGKCTPCQQGKKSSKK